MNLSIYRIKFLIILSLLLHSIGLSQAKISLKLDTLANLLLVNEQGFVMGNSHDFGLEMPVLLDEIQQSKEGKLIARVIGMQQSPTCQIKELYAICQTNEEVRQITVDHLEALMIERLGKRKSKRLLSQRNE